MDFYHRKPQRSEQSTGRDCQFCAAFDPNFGNRNPVDRWVHGTPYDSANSHLSENGHVLHLISELAIRRGEHRSAEPASLLKTA
jgi:hypothetical protein